ncbi:MAG: hypothetical protein D6824_09560, partial [Planctomycetota bacterium]
GQLLFAQRPVAVRVESAAQLLPVRLQEAIEQLRCVAAGADPIAQRAATLTAPVLLPLHPAIDSTSGAPRSATILPTLHPLMRLPVRSTVTTVVDPPGPLTIGSTVVPDASAQLAGRGLGGSLGRSGRQRRSLDDLAC